jgi:hypothetical protein
MTEFYLDPRLKQLIDSQGAPSNDLLVEESISIAESIAKRMLGCTIDLKGKKFILTNLELYYGGVGDLAHDWHRARYQTKSSSQNVIERTDIQFDEGIKIYISNKAGTRLVIGPKNVAISLLMRNIATEDGILIGDLNGNPNIIIRPEHLNIKDEHNGDIVSLIDTHHQYIPQISEIQCRKRFTEAKFDGFQDQRFGQRLWNFSISHLFKKV